MLHALGQDAQTIGKSGALIHALVILCFADVWLGERRSQQMQYRLF